MELDGRLALSWIRLPLYNSLVVLINNFTLPIFWTLRTNQKAGQKIEK